MARINFDYESVLARLKERTLSKLDGEQLLMFSTNSALLEAVAEEFDDANLYDEYLTREAVWETAQDYNSIVRQVGFYAYKPHRKVGSSGRIVFSSSPTFDGSWAHTITIPKFTIVSGGGITFLTKEQSFLEPTKTIVEIPVIQGERIVSTVEITPAAFPELRYASVVIKDPDIENSLYLIKVNGIEWKEVSSIRLATSGSDKVYTLRTLSDFSGVEITFGNDIFGKKLEHGDIVTFEYLQTKGAYGNILSKGIITSVNSPITDETGEEVPMYCTNLDPMVGGDDYETLASIRAYAPLSFQTGDRAISSADYATLIKSAGLAQKIQVWGEKEINEDAGNKPGTYIPASENLIYITGFDIDTVTGEGIPLTETKKAQIRDYLNSKKGTTDILQFVDTQIIYVTFTSDVYMSNTRYSSEQVVQNVHNALIKDYGLSTAEYKKNLYFSDYYRTIDAAEGVDHHTTELSFSEFRSFTSAYLFTADLNINNILPGSIKLYVKNSTDVDWTLMGHDNGLGVLVGDYIDPDDPSQGSFDIVSESISYENGSLGEILVTYGLSGSYSFYDIRVDFELQATENGNLILPYRQQLFAFYNNKTYTHLMGAV